MQNKRIVEIYEITKDELKSGEFDIMQYRAILMGLIREEDYEAAEGVRLAISEYGIQFNL